MTGKAAVALVGLVVIGLSADRLRAADRGDLLIADFEGDTYGDWKTTGTAFGPGPAKGTLPNQMPVTGFLGKGLVNSYHGGDASTGTLTSPPITVRRHYINFLIGGGKYPGKTCINLLVDGKVVRTATGPNDRPGGSEQLHWHTWDVKDLAGRKAVLQIVDDHTGGWGHINVDHIVQSDRALQEQPARREVAIEQHYLNLPVRTGAPRRRMQFQVDGKTVREFDIELADAAPSFWAFAEVGSWRGKKLTLAVDALPGDSRALEAVSQSDQPQTIEPVYREKSRPQFHFTSKVGWLNDPNGLVYDHGEYHLFYQHNPYGWDWGNMHWGHAVSKDLFHWKERPIALYPQRYDDWCFSGSAVVDHHNTAGLTSGGEDVLAALYTSTGRGECLAYSTDRGRTWTDYSGNPVVRHVGRDPKVVWYRPAKQWVMAVYDEFEGKRLIAFYTSPDLKRWQFQSRIEGFFECPDLFELPVDGTDDRRWVLYAADGKYVLGNFDGKVFHVESGKHQLWYGNFYAAQTYSDTPDGRRVQIGWGSGITFAGSCFNQQMTVPCRLTLRPTKDGVRMFAEPVEELRGLQGRKHTFADDNVTEKVNRLVGISGDLFDIEAELEVAEGAESLGFRLRGVPVTYDPNKKEITCNKVVAPLFPDGGTIRLRLLLDRGSIEVFGNDGRMALSVGVSPADGEHALEFLRPGRGVKVRKLDVVELKSAWID